MSNFWTGVVEDRNDPLFLGRLRVRIFGIHSELKVSSKTTGSPTENLLWCYTMQPTTSAAISGVGTSPTGIVEGSHVVGFFRDKMCQDGVVIGTIPGIPQSYANPDRGFSDPSGRYPSYINEPDTHTLARGGITPTLDGVYGGKPTQQTPITVEEQNLNVDKAPSPNKSPADDIIPSPPPGDYGIEEMLRDDEGVRLGVYWDHLGYPTIGVGHLIVYEKTRNMQQINSILSQHVGRTINNGRITDSEVSTLFKGDIAKVKSGLVKNSTTGPVYAKMDTTRKMAMENMAFQMGVGGLAQFTTSLGYMFEEKWQQAHDNLLKSKWARQTPGRANRVAKIVLNGNLSSYGVKPEAPETNYLMLFASKDQDSNDLFTEPNSPYNAVYPYNTVECSESGHITEVDDTPGAERLKRMHCSGTFEEIHPDGTRVTKVVGDDYLIVKSGRNVHISGNLNVVIDGNSTISVLGDTDLTVGGNVTELVRGNVTQQIDGFVNSTINGNARVEVKKSCEAIVQDDLNVTVNRNVTANVQGDMDATVVGNTTVTSENISIDAKKNIKMNAEVIDIEASKLVNVDGGVLTSITGGSLKLG